MSKVSEAPKSWLKHLRPPVEENLSMTNDSTPLDILKLHVLLFKSGNSLFLGIARQ